MATKTDLRSSTGGESQNDDGSTGPKELFAAVAVTAIERSQECLAEEKRILPGLEPLARELLRKECIGLTPNIVLGSEIATALEEECLAFIWALADAVEEQFPQVFKALTKSAIEEMSPQFQRDAVSAICKSFAVDLLAADLVNAVH